ncbi:MAG TPA: hypothetical protein VGL77_00425, partial [Armatimonadota bacterium]
RLSIGRESADHSGAAIIQLANSHRPGAEPLEVSGYLPFSWLRPMTPAIPRNEPFALNVRLPEQGLDVVKSYLPIFAKTLSLQGDGTIAGEVGVGGTLAYPAFSAKSFLLAKAPNLLVQGVGQVVPSRLHNVVVDLGFRSETRNGHAENVVEVNDFSAIGDRYAVPKAPQSFLAQLKNILGQRKAPQEVIPSIVAQGAIRLLPPANGWPSLMTMRQQSNALLAQCRYDLYAKALHIPLNMGKTYQGMLTSYLHLANRTPGMERPLLTGLLYLENSKLVYQGGQTTPFTMPQLPLSPTLSIFVQTGANNTFTIAPNNALLRGSILAVFPLTPTGPKLFPPNMVADPSESEYLQAGGRPLIDRHPLHDLSPDFLDKQAASEKYANGTYGVIRGTLAKPEIEVTYVLEPRKSQVQLPGGLLVVQSAHGSYATNIGSDMPARLQVEGSARGALDTHTVEAAIDGNLLQEGDIHNMVTFTDTAYPSGERALGDSEIFARLIGVPDLVALVQGKERVFSPMILTTLGPNMLLSSWVRRLASTVNLETLSVGLDPSWAPEASLTTPEIGTTRWSAFRLGASRTFATDPAWRLWLDYRIPNQRSWLRNVTMTGDTNNLHEQNLSLQYQLQFKTSPKK